MEQDLSQLSDAELRDKLKAVGAVVGPITGTTRRLFENKLRRLLAPNQDEASESTVPASCPKVEEKNEVKCETPAAENVGPVTYFGVALPPEKCNPEKAHECVFIDRKEALKFAKSETDARFKEFQTKEEAVAFASKPAVQQPSYMPPTKAPVGESSAFKGPKVPELSKFKALIEKGELEAVHEIIWANPRYLISSGDSPVILQVGCRYNAMHVCALKNRPEAAQLVLDTLEDTAFMARLYPDDTEEARHDRIRHIVDLYLNMPDKGNCEAPLHFACKFGNVEMVEFLVNCKRINLEQLNLHRETPRQIVCSRSKEKGVKDAILKIMEAIYYVPLMRPADKSSIARVGKPWSPAESQEPNITNDNNRNNSSDPTMSPLVLHALAGPMSPSQASSFRRKWMQHTTQKDRLNFLSICCKDDEKGQERIGRMLAKEEGIHWSEYWDFLEDYIDLSSPDGLRMLDDYLEQVNHDVSISVPNNNDSMLSYIEDQSNAHMSEDEEGKDDSFLALLGSLDNQFSKLRIKSPSPVKAKIENVGALAEEGQASENETKSLNADDLPQFCDTTTDGQGNYKKSIAENIGVHGKHSGLVWGNSERNASECRPILSSRSGRGSGDTEFESCDSGSEGSVDTFYTAASANMSPPYNLSSPLSKLHQPVFILGLEPSRVDTDVLNALGDQPITPEYPNVARWKKHVAGFTEETRNSWSSPRKDHRLNMSLGSPRRNQTFNTTPRSCSRLSSFITPQRMNLRNIPTLLFKDAVKTNLNTVLDV